MKSIIGKIKDFCDKFVFICSYRESFGAKCLVAKKKKTGPEPDKRKGSIL